MVIDEGARHRLFQRLEQVLGAEEAEVLMQHLPPVGWGDVATKQDVALQLSALEGRLLSEMDQRFSKVYRTLAFTVSSAILTVAALAFGAAQLV